VHLHLYYLGQKITEERYHYGRSKILRVPKIRHLGKPLFPECCIGGELHSREKDFPECQKVHGTRGRDARGGSHLPRVQHSGKRGTRKRKFAFDGDIGWNRLQKSWKKISPDTLSLALGEGSLFPECLALALREGCLFPKSRWLALDEGSLPRVPEKALGEDFCFFLPHFFLRPSYYLKLLAQIWSNFEFFLVYFVSFFVS
jgi:hypothetical protein